MTNFIISLKKFSNKTNDQISFNFSFNSFIKKELYKYLKYLKFFLYFKILIFKLKV